MVDYGHWSLLDFPYFGYADMTAEGAFPLGAAVVVSQIQAGTNPWIATLLALLAGMVAGLVSGMLHTKMKIPALLTGIVTLTGLYSINIKIMGSVPNLPWEILQLSFNIGELWG